MKYIFLILLVTNFQFQLKAQIDITINSTIDTSKLKIFFIDGAIFNNLSLEFLNNKTRIQNRIKSKYARIIFTYPINENTSSGFCFLVKQKKSKIEFAVINDSNKSKLSNFKILNLVDTKNGLEYKKIDAYCKKELTFFNAISAINLTEQNDSNQLRQIQAYYKLAFKQMEYIKTNNDNYFYFERFIQEIVPSLREDYTAELYEYFNTTFPKEFKESYEGKCTNSLLEGKLFIKVGAQAPSFTTKDYLGKSVDIKNFNGKFILLSYWATWCSPCIKEIPKLKEFKKNYDISKLEIISISKDLDSVKFNNAIKKYDMNWTHIFNKPEMLNLFGNKPIPSLYLIDKNGKIIFSSWEKNMEELETILKKELGN